MFMSNRKINIGAGVAWNETESHNASSYFPDYEAGQNVPRRVGKAFHNADPQALINNLSDTPIGNNTGTAEVRAVRNNPDLLVKLSRHEPFSHTAVNVLLEKAWQRNPRLKTPHYLGHMSTPNFSATLMTRAEGTQIADTDSKLSPEALAVVQRRVMAAGRLGLQGYGVDPELVDWDLTTRNIFHDGRLPATHPDNTLTVIDQNTTKHMGARKWSALQDQAHDLRDPRDIAAADALGGQDAFDKFLSGV
jgi:hypothetical protein